MSQFYAIKLMIRRPSGWDSSIFRLASVVCKWRGYNAPLQQGRATIYMRWKDIRVEDRTFSMAHLQPFDLVFDVAHEQVTVKFEFGLHCFTDDKGNGHLIHYRGERRYFCRERYHCSTQLVEYIQKRFFQGLAVPFYTESSQRYFCLDLHDYAIFFSISKPQGTTNLLKLRIISAYEVATWGRTTLPRGKPHNIRYILEMRNAGKSV